MALCWFRVRGSSFQANFPQRFCIYEKPTDGLSLNGESALWHTLKKHPTHIFASRFEEKVAKLGVLNSRQRGCAEVLVYSESFQGFFLFLNPEDFYVCTKG